MSACLRAGPFSIPRTRLAKFREQSVSPRSAALGLTWTNIKVLQSPPAFFSTEKCQLNLELCAAAIRCVQPTLRHSDKLHLSLTEQNLT